MVITIATPILVSFGQGNFKLSLHTFVFHFPGNLSLSSMDIFYVMDTAVYEKKAILVRLKFNHLSLTIS